MAEIIHHVFKDNSGFDKFFLLLLQLQLPQTEGWLDVVSADRCQIAIHLDPNWQFDLIAYLNSTTKTINLFTTRTDLTLLQQQ